MKRSEKLSDKVTISKGQCEGFSELLEKADRAYRDELGAGCYRLSAEDFRANYQANSRGLWYPHDDYNEKAAIQGEKILEPC